MRTNRAIIIGVVVLLVLVAIAYAWATWKFFTIPVPGGNDFLAHYSVWDLYIKEGVNPYSEEAALYTQELIRGRPAQAGEDENRLTYPFYSIVFHGPFTFIDYPLARAIYMTALQGAIIFGVMLTLSLFDWRPAPWMLGAVFVWSILNYPEARAVILGQFAPFAFLSMVAALFLLRKQNDFLAGAIMVVSTIKPTLVFLLIPLLIFWAISRRRWGLLYGFGGVLGLVTIGSLIMLPSWIGDWISRILLYPQYTVGESPIWLLTNLFLPSSVRIGELSLTIILVIVLLVVWWRFLRKKDDHEFYWIIGFTLLISNLIVPRSATTNYVMFLFPILGFFASIEREWWYGARINIVIMVLSVVGHWWLHAVTVVGNQEQAILFLPFPITIGILLVFGRSFFMRNAIGWRVKA